MTEHTQIVSSAPGRTRFKLPSHHRNPEEMARISSALQSHPDVDNVQYNAQTGSILVHHNPHHRSLEQFEDIMKDFGVIFADVTGSAELLSFDGTSESSFDLTKALSDLNQQVLLATNGVVDLQYVLPLGLGAIAVLQLLTFGWQFELVPWFVLGYFAVDSYIKLNSNQASATQNS